MLCLTTNETTNWIVLNKRTLIKVLIRLFLFAKQTFNQRYLKKNTFRFLKFYEESFFLIKLSSIAWYCECIIKRMPHPRLLRVIYNASPFV